MICKLHTGRPGCPHVPGPCDYVLACMSARLSEQVSERVAGGWGGGVMLAAVPVVSRAADQVAHEAQSEARLANGLRVS